MQNRKKLVAVSLFYFAFFLLYVAVVVVVVVFIIAVTVVVVIIVVVAVGTYFLLCFYGTNQPNFCSFCCWSIFTFRSCTLYAHLHKIFKIYTRTHIQTLTNVYFYMCANMPYTIINTFTYIYVYYMNVYMDMRVKSEKSF